MGPLQVLHDGIRLSHLQFSFIMAILSSIVFLLPKCSKDASSQIIRIFILILKQLVKDADRESHHPACPYVRLPRLVRPMLLINYLNDAGAKQNGLITAITDGTRGAIHAPVCCRCSAANNPRLTQRLLVDSGHARPALF